MKRRKKRQSKQQARQNALLSPKMDDSGQSEVAEGIERLLAFLRRNGWLLGLILMAATILVYQPVWHAGFIWDDDYYVTNNQTLHTLDGLRQIWFVPGATLQYYPLTFTTFWMEYHLWELNPLGYHLINVLLHACNVTLLWLILRKLGVRGAWLAAALFALHPVCVESVVWVTERKNTLSGFFYLGSILVAMKFWLPDETSLESAVTGRDKDSTAGFGSWKFYWLAFVLYVCALCSKTATLPLPAVILLLVWWKRGRIVWRDVYPLGVFLAAGIIMGLMTLHVENHGGASGKEWAYSWLERCLLAGRDVWFYLGKLSWPHPLIFVYPRWTVETSKWTAYLPVLALVAGLSILWWKRNAWSRAPLVALLYFLALLFLVLGFFNVYYFRYSFVADHFQYLASIGPLALAASGITTASGVFGKRNRMFKPVFCGVLLLALGVLTWRQCWMYADEETLWRTTIQRNPASWMAYDNLGELLIPKGRMDEAIVQLQRALAIKPDDDEALNNLGNVLLQIGQVDGAIIQFQRALAIKPVFANAYNNLGIALIQKGQTDEAIIQFQKVLAIKPDNAVAHENLGNALLQKGQIDEAIFHYQRALAIQPDNVVVHDNLGNAFIQKGRLDEAIIQFQRTLAIQPDLVEALNGLANIAWVLATSPDPSVRNGTKAVELA